jgi:hypothetical protein
MTKEFKKIYNHSETRYILETTSGATGSSAIGATPGNLLRELQRRISELKDTVKVPTAKPRNPTGMGSTPGRGTQKHQPNQRQKSRDDKKLNGEGVLEDEDAIKAFLSKGGQVQQGRYHKPRKSEKTNYGSRHIGTGKSGDISGVAANTRPDSKPVVSVENDQEQDHEISMASSELQSIAKDAAQLLDMVRQKSEEEGLEAWQQSKITKAADFMNSVLQSLSGDEQGVAEGSGPQKGDPVYYGSRLVGWFLGYSKYGKVITKPNYDEMGDEYANRDVYWDKDAVTIKSDKQGVAESEPVPGKYSGHFYDAKILSNGDYEIVKINSKKDENGKSNPLNLEVGAVVPKSKAHAFQYIHNGGMFDQLKDVAEGLSDTQKKIKDTILKLEQRLKFAKTPEQWDNIKNRIERLQAGLNRSKPGVAEAFGDVDCLKNIPDDMPKMKAAINALQHTGVHFRQQDYMEMFAELAGYKNIGDMLRAQSPDGKISQQAYNEVDHLAYKLENLGMQLAGNYRNVWRYKEDDPRCEEYIDILEQWFDLYKMAKAKYMKKTQQGIVEVFKGPSDYEIYHLNTNEKASEVFKDFKATDHRDAAIKADEKLEKYGISGQGFGVRPVTINQNVGEEKIKGVDGKACWKSYRYNGTKDGKDDCVKVSEDAYLESLASKLEELKKK